MAKQDRVWLVCVIFSSYNGSLERDEERTGRKIRKGKNKP